MLDLCILHAGELKHAITINAPSATRDASGQPGSTWSLVLTTRAKIESTSSQTFKLSFQNSTLASDTTDCITIRYSAVDIAPGYQILFGDETYTITAVDDIQRRHRVLVMACTSVDVGSQ
jgi:SPP1 family predicted phage head-tail adaptor